MLKKLIFWYPLFVLISILFDAIVHYGDTAHQWMCITAGTGWLLYWIELYESEKKESDTDA